jgi:flagellar biosynthesis protein FlhA
MLQRGMAVEEALDTYAIMTIGDGLVTQIPALLLAVATGVIVTRSNAEADMGTTTSAQLTQSHIAVTIAGAAAIVLGLIPGMPILPFAVVGLTLIILGRRLATLKKRRELEAVEAVRTAEDEAPKDGPEDLIEQMRVHALEIQLSPDLVPIASGSDDLLGRVRALRRRLAMELGIVVPPVRTRDNVELPLSTYVIRVAGVEAGRGTAPVGRVLALGEHLDALPGTETVDPVFGMAGKWVPVEMRHGAEMAGATVIDRVSVIITHLSAIISSHAPRLLSREDVRVLTDGVKQINPAAVDELVPSLLSLAEVQRVLQGLLAERVPINDLGRIYEALALRAKVSNDPDGLIEAARAALGPVIAQPHLEGGRLHVVMIEPLLEQAMLEALRPSEMGAQIVFDPARLEAVITSLSRLVEQARQSGTPVALVCAPALRPAVRRLVSTSRDGLPVLSYQEAAAAQTPIETVGVVRVLDPIAV